MRPQIQPTFGDVAICISGQIRTGIEAAPSFKAFFSRNSDVFYHAWDDKTTDIKLINELYQPISSVVQSPMQEHSRNSQASMLYSMMMANELKRREEIRRGRRYKMVVKTRFDLIFDPSVTMVSSLPRPRMICYSQAAPGWVSSDYENWGISDTFFFGDSKGMDIACDTYRYMFFDCLSRARRIMVGEIIDKHDSMCSPGVLIYQQCAKRNVMMVCLDHPPDVIFRSGVKHMDPILDFDKIKEYHLSGQR